MDYKKLNNYVGWGIFAFAMIVYFLTMSPTASYWDCGEFIACSNELEVPHPPGAPFFLLVGRIFAMFAFGNVELISYMINIMSALTAGFTVLFTFWITTHLARRILNNTKELLSQGETIAVMGAGVVAAMTCTFADSFWFNAVEAEVYAMSSFFTAIVVWVMLKWEERADEPGNERWIVLIAYLMGLSIGVHLLNLLTIPALAFIYYFRKYEFSWGGFFVTGAVSVAILGFIQTGIILWTFDIAWAFEQFFSGVILPSGRETGLGMPLGTGLTFLIILLFGTIVGLIYYSIKIKHVALNTFVMSTLVIFIGFSSYTMIPIRSQANPPIDENDPENSSSFLSYMKREQYGDRPLLFGPMYNINPTGYDEKREYVLEEGKSRYTDYGVRRTYTYADADKKFFPRMYERGRYNMGPHAYLNYVKRTGEKNDRGVDVSPLDDKPTPGEDLKFFLDYQVRHMYWRYFMWNFAGKESYFQDADWESGLNFSKTASMPDFIRNQPSKNHYYLIPLLMGLLGLFWQANKRGSDAVVVGLLFFFTGLAIIIYLNQYPSQPRERDYSFAGSFQTFAIWVGLGVIALYELLQRFLKGAGSAYAALSIGLIAPLLMGFQNWDDHSRSGRYVAPDSAYNLLNSLEKNAVLFTNGDNDTFPLWYIQEVEGVRTDVRVLCLSYVNTDWYIEQMMQQVNQSAPLPITLKKSEYTGQAKQAMYLKQKQISLSLPVDVPKLLSDSVISQAEVPFVTNPLKWTFNTRGGANNNYLELKDVLIINLLENVAKSGWERPIYFANTVTPSSFLGLSAYLRLEGLAYRILPVRNPLPADPFDPYQGSIEPDRMFTNLTQKFRYRNLNNPDVYFDENIQRMLGNYHGVFYRLTKYYYLEAEKLKNQNLAIDRTIETVAGANLDSLQQVKSTNASAQSAFMAKGKELMTFGEEAFPYEVVAPDPYIVVRAGIMWDRLGEGEKAQEYFDYARNQAEQTLEYYAGTGDYFKNSETFLVSLRLLAQHYSVGESRDPEKQQELIQVINSLDQRLR